MNKIALISISLLFLVISIGCTAAADWNGNDAPLGGGLGGGGDDGASPLNNVVNDSVVDDGACPLNNVVNDSDDSDHPWAVSSNGPNIFTSDLLALPALPAALTLGGCSSGLGGDYFVCEYHNSLDILSKHFLFLFLILYGLMYFLFF